MPYLGIQTDAAHAFEAQLRQGAVEIEQVQQLIAEAEALSDVASHATMPLDEMRADWLRSASEIARALAILEMFRIELSAMLSWSSVVVPTPVRTPVPIDAVDVDVLVTSVAPRWNASPGAAWNDVHQDASHNSYAVPGGADVLFGLGVRTFELDIHRGPPARLWPAANPIGASDAKPDWRVFHFSADSKSEYDFLSDGLDAIAALDTTEPLTIFIDNKDSFAERHTPERLDQVLVASLGDRLYRPAEFAARAPGASSLQAVVDEAGWPTVQELDGRIIVVLTDEIESYEGNGSAAFVAAAPTLVRTDDGVEHVEAADRVFYNANHRHLDDADIEAVQASGSVLRTYFNPLCSLTPFGETPILPNYRAIDIEPTSPGCGSGVYVAPVDTPVPEPIRAEPESG